MYDDMAEVLNLEQDNVLDDEAGPGPGASQTKKPGKGSTGISLEPSGLQKTNKVSNEQCMYFIAVIYNTLMHNLEQYTSFQGSVSG